MLLGTGDGSANDDVVGTGPHQLLDMLLVVDAAFRDDLSGICEEIRSYYSK